jgi:hypothetical protein
MVSRDADLIRCPPLSAARRPADSNSDVHRGHGIQDVHPIRTGSLAILRYLAIGTVRHTTYRSVNFAAATWQLVDSQTALSMCSRSTRYVTRDRWSGGRVNDRSEGVTR